MKFEYLEVRPCIAQPEAAPNGIVTEQVTSFIDEDEFERAIADLAADDANYRAFWTLYGRYDDGDGAFLAMAIGDFMTKEDAHEVMNAILAPMATARDLALEHLQGDADLTAVSNAVSVLEDFINQCSNSERV